MSISRRIFIRQVLSIGPIAMTFWVEDLWGRECNKPDPSADCSLPKPGTATRLIPNEPRVVTRYSAAEIAASSKAAQLQALRDGTCMVRDLPPSNLVSWTKFVAQHCINCTGSSNPNNVHYNWQFLPWHRALLYFAERVMRKLTKTDDLRLVYWDWENPASNRLPSIYAPKDQPLYWGNRGNLSGPQWPLTPEKVNVQGLLVTESFDDFGGTAKHRQPVPGTYMGPHANVHNNFSPGDMSNLLYSPRDPVFYAHHSNIDRLWSSWSAIKGHKNPDFGDARAIFYDENQQLRYILFNDLVDETKLGYHYSSLMKPKVNPALLKSFVVPATANHIRVPGTALKQLRANGPAFLNITNIHNLDKFAVTERTFGIFAVKPEVGINGFKAAGFLGITSRVLSDGHDHDAENDLSAQIEVTGRLGQRMAKEGTLDLFVAPLDLEGKTTAPAIPLVADKIKLIE